MSNYRQHFASQACAEFPLSISECRSIALSPRTNSGANRGSSSRQPPPNAQLVSVFPGPSRRRFAAPSHTKKNNEGISSCRDKLHTLGLWALSMHMVKFSSSIGERRIGYAVRLYPFMRSVEHTPALSGGNRSQHSDRDHGQTAPHRAYTHQVGGVR